MTGTDFHPATFQLLRLQSRGRRRRMWQRFRRPGRLALSAVACVLGVVWLGNAAMTVWLREAASAETLSALLSLGLVFYAAWHLAKAAFFRPESPFDWSPAERDLLAALPLESRDLVAYQIASVTVTTSIKTGLFALLLLPDLRCVPLALVGLFLAMMTLELLRMAVEIATWGMSRRAYLAYRVVVVAGLLAGALAVIGVIVREGGPGGQINFGEGVLERLLDILLKSDASVFGYAALAFGPFIDLIAAEGISASRIGLAAAAVGAVALYAAAVIGLYAAAVRLVVQRERRHYQLVEQRAVKQRAVEQRAGDLCLARSESRPMAAGGFVPLLKQLPRWGGAGPLAWRQLIGARRTWGSLLTAMIAPAVLACCPCFVIADANIALLATAATLAFYTFLLLPTAIRFDFRRDLDRIAMFKGLPIAPAAAVIGQVVVPVFIATLFQSVVLAFATYSRSLPPHYFFTVMLVMVPLNALVFSLDNLIFLLYPHRLQQEGVEIFVRTMLTFTGKGLLFAMGLGAMSAWGFAAAASTRGIAQWTGFTVDAFAVFAAGMFVGPCALAAVVLYALARTYCRLDVAEDLPR
jgi:hypothetical protein